MSLYRLMGQFLRRHRAAYAVSAVMLLGIALLIVWIPRQIGALVDGLVAHRLSGGSLLRELAPWSPPASWCTSCASAGG